MADERRAKRERVLDDLRQWELEMAVEARRQEQQQAVEAIRQVLRAALGPVLDWLLRAIEATRRN